VPDEVEQWLLDTYPAIEAHSCNEWSEVDALLAKVAAIERHEGSRIGQRALSTPAHLERLGARVGQRYCNGLLPRVALRAYRKRRREAMRYVRIPLHVTEVDALIRIGRLKEDSRTDAEVLQAAVLSLLYQALGESEIGRERLRYV